MTEERTSGFDAVVLAGGESRRMGTDKTRVDVGGRPVLDRVLDAVADAARVVVVGPERPVARPVLWTREQPPGGGPAAAVAAGLALVEQAQVVVVAGDLPLLTASAVTALREASRGHDGAVLVDDDGEEQLLAGCWRTEALRAAAVRSGTLAGRSVRSLLADLDRARVRPSEGAPMAWLDCDTPEALQKARERA